MINHFTFNGTSTAQLGLIVSGVSIFGAGSRKVEKAGIPGRNGDLQIELGGFNNYTVRYTVSITNDFTTTAQQIREWLLESKGYCELTDTYHPDEIRKACFNSDIEFTTTMLYKYGQASIQFDCLPERYIIRNTPVKTGPNATTTENTEVILNTTKAPLRFTLNGNSASASAVTGSNQIIITGKNLLSSTTYKTGNNLYIGSGGSSYSIHLPAGTYTFTKNSNKAVGSYCKEQNDPANTQIISGHSGYASATVTLAGGNYRFWFYASGGVSNSDIISYQLEAGTTATEFEEYTSQAYEVDLPVTNLLNQNNLINGNVLKKNADGTFTFTKVGSGIDNRSSAWASCAITANTSYVFSCKAIGTLPNTVSLRTGTNETGIDSCGAFTRSGNVFTVSFTATADAEQIQIYYSSGSTGVGGSVILYDFQIEEGTKRNEYTPYGMTPVALGSSDTITKSNNKWYINSAAITYSPLIAQLEELQNAYSYNKKTYIMQKANANPFIFDVISLNAEEVPSAYNGEPIIQANSTGLIVFNGEVLEVLSAPVTINCQTMQCYNGSVNMNNEVVVSEFPTMIKGDNLVASDMELTITPNNWRH